MQCFLLFTILQLCNLARSVTVDIEEQRIGRAWKTVCVQLTNTSRNQILVSWLFSGVYHVRTDQGEEDSNKGEEV